MATELPAEIGARTLVMGVLNVTPDSFSDGGRFVSVEAALAHAKALRDAGADLIDIGGESTRPGAEPVSVEEELARVVPVVAALAACGHRGLSVDTTKAEVARQAIAAGASVVNDISGLGFEPELARAVAEGGAAIIVGHTRGRPKTMQSGPIFYPEGVLEAVQSGLRRSIDAAVAAGVPRSRIWADPGFGFGKTTAHNIELLRRLSELLALSVPLVVGTSRKRFLGDLTGRGVGERDFATAASVAIAVLGGAAVVRVHHVGAAVDAVRVADAVRRGGGS